MIPVLSLLSDDQSTSGQHQEDPHGLHSIEVCLIVTSSHSEKSTVKNVCSGDVQTAQKIRGKKTAPDNIKLQKKPRYKRAFYLASYQ